MHKTYFSAWERVTNEFNRLTSKSLNKKQIQKKYSDMKYRQKVCLKCNCFAHVGFQEDVFTTLGKEFIYKLYDYKNKVLLHIYNIWLFTANTFEEL